MQLLKIKDVMQLTGLSRSSLYSMVKKNEVPHYQFRTSIRFKEEEIMDWIDENKK